MIRLLLLSALIHLEKWQNIILYNVDEILIGLHDRTSLGSPFLYKRIVLDSFHIYGILLYLSINCIIILTIFDVSLGENFHIAFEIPSEPFALKLGLVRITSLIDSSFIIESRNCCWSSSFKHLLMYHIESCVGSRKMLVSFHSLE